MTAEPDGPLQHMAKNRRQHYVPQFYLRKFGGGPRQIDLVNLSDGRLLRNASIKTQCYRNYFYGEDGELERQFAVHEGTLAEILHRVHENLWIPQRNTVEWTNLMMFVAMQHTRTLAAAQLTDELFDRAAHEIFAEDDGIDKATLEQLRIRATNPIRVSLSAARDTAIGLDDLHAMLITAEQPGFATSDHPVCMYNTYAEAVKWAGVAGAYCSGLQVFYPLTPTCCLLLYDGKIYAVSPKRAVHRATADDVNQINRIVASQANRNVYFGPWMTDDYARELVKSVVMLRERPRIRFHTADEVRGSPRPDGTRRVLLHMFFPFPVVRLRLSMVRLRKQAKKTPVLARGSEYRRSAPNESRGSTEPGVFQVRRGPSR